MLATGPETGQDQQSRCLSFSACWELSYAMIGNVPKKSRSTSAWAASTGLADLSNVALLQRLRNSSAWMEHLVGQLLGGGAVPAARGRHIRLLDGTAVPKAGKEAKENNGLWRLHCTFDLPSERFSHIELTDEKGG